MTRTLAATMANLTAQEVAAKWKQRTSAAQQDYVDGATRTEKDPTALAIAAGPRYLASVQRSFNDGTWANGLRRAGRQGWIDGIKNKGATNFANGVNNAEAKVAQAFGPLLAFQDGLKREISAMPNVTDQDREARALRWMRGQRQYKKSS